jgi:hypothetical protein
LSADEHLAEECVTLSQRVKSPCAKVGLPRLRRRFSMTLSHLDLAIGASDALMIRDHVKRFVAIRLRLGGVATPRGSLPIEVDVNQEDLAVTGNYPHAPSACRELSSRPADPDRSEIRLDRGPKDQKCVGAGRGPTDQRHQRLDHLSVRS